MHLRTINEGYGRTYEFPYEKFGTDPRPRLLLLGKYRHPTTRNVLLGGINLNYLNDEQLKSLRQNLKTILQPKNLQLRYWRGRRLLPEIFNSDGAYRTYDVDYVGSVTKDTLTFWPSVGELEKAEKVAKDQEMQQYDKDMKAQHKIGRQVRPTLTAPEPEPAPEPGDVLTTEPEPTTAPTKPQLAPPAEVELARPETEVTPEPEVGQEQPQPAVAQEPAQAGPAGAAAQQPEVEAPPARGLVRGGAGREKEGAGAPAPKAKRLTSTQRRRQQAEQIKKALETQRQKKQKPEPPDELKGIMGMFKPKK